MLRNCVSFRFLSQSFLEWENKRFPFPFVVCLLLLLLFRLVFILFFFSFVVCLFLSFSFSVYSPLFVFVIFSSVFFFLFRLSFILLYLFFLVLSASFLFRLAFILLSLFFWTLFFIYYRLFLSRCLSPLSSHFLYLLLLSPLFFRFCLISFMLYPLLTFSNICFLSSVPFFCRLSSYLSGHPFSSVFYQFCNFLSHFSFLSVPYPRLLSVILLFSFLFIIFFLSFCPLFSILHLLFRLSFYRLFLFSYILPFYLYPLSSSSVRY